MPSERSEKTRSKPEGLSGISDTGRWSVCPCGRQHTRPASARQRRGVLDPSKLTQSVYDALAAGKATIARNRTTVHYSGNCESPIRMRRNASSGGVFVEYEVRCRRCKPCLRARQFYWARTAMDWTKFTADNERRTWFGTLTFTEAAQAEALQAAFWRWAETTGRSHADWWDEPLCDERFRLVREIQTGWVQRYWKRLRKGVKRCAACYPAKPRRSGEWDHPPAAFKYFLVFERHKSGYPHIHWLLHEMESPILLKQLSCAWPHGFVKIKLVKGDDIAKAGFYVSKYLGKAIQSRQIASTGYAKLKHTLNVKQTSPTGQFE